MQPSAGGPEERAPRPRLQPPQEAAGGGAWWVLVGPVLGFLGGLGYLLYILATGL